MNKTFLVLVLLLIAISCVSCIDNSYQNPLQMKDTTIKLMSDTIEYQRGVISQQQDTIRIFANKLANNKLRCPWQSALHNPNLVDKYTISVDYIPPNTQCGNQWIHEYNKDFYYFPKDAIVYLKTLEEPEEGTLLIDVCIMNNSENKVMEYQQTVFRHPQDAINYLEHLDTCQ